ncbi:hypothetical protein [sulfur-oxidizing endosymbiont of Gigantopelta aegis]|uniref:hypothetical protein n=1 Tax=sulfur-oxidizing endosymbiont of Gigantopelta aegis TaxID=2794934 RepID=UPI0018DCB313|nr:hypothetical protein [sulfur-oxidizing endosymbiont of Gigantopelta aegis]
MGIKANNALSDASNTLRSTTIQHEEVAYNPDTGKIENRRYSQFYQLKTDIVPARLELSLVTQLLKKSVPGGYSIKEFTRRQQPSDYLADSHTQLYLKNITDKPITFDLRALSIEHQKLPFSERQLSIPGKESLSIELGSVRIDLRLITLFTRIEYIVQAQGIAKDHQEKEFDMHRMIKKYPEKPKQ